MRVETYTINGMAHGTLIDPGPGEDQCGTPGAFILDADTNTTQVYYQRQVQGIWAALPEVAFDRVFPISLTLLANSNSSHKRRHRPGED